MHLPQDTPAALDKLIEAVEEIRCAEREKWLNLAIWLAKHYQTNFDNIHNTENIGKGRSGFGTKLYYSFLPISNYRHQQIVKRLSLQEVDEKLLEQTLTELEREQLGPKG